MTWSESQAHHGPNGTFRNPWPDSEPRGLADVLRWTRERRQHPRVPTPERQSFLCAKPHIAYPHSAAGDFSATWVGHSTVLLQIGELNVITDPVFSQRAFPVQWMGPRRVMDPALTMDALPPIDVVLLSHSHYDHLDKPAVRRLARDHPRAHWIVPLGLRRYISGWGAKEITELDWGQQVRHSDLTVTATPARHFSARRLGDRNKTLWCGFAVEKGERRAYFAGDTAYHPEFNAIGRSCGPFDFVMMPIGAYDPRWFMHVVHMDPEEAVRAYTDIIAPHAAAPHPIMLGIHWGTFRLTDEPMEEPPVRAAACWQATGLDPSRLWIAKFGETRSW